jgi:hypothetical protein
VLNPARPEVFVVWEVCLAEEAVGLRCLRGGGRYLCDLAFEAWFASVSGPLAIDRRRAVARKLFQLPACLTFLKISLIFCRHCGVARGATRPVAQKCNDISTGLAESVSALAQRTASFRASGGR